MTHRQLYGLAALLWLIAGVNVLRIGLVNWPSETNILVSILWLIGSLAFFAGFIFPSVVKRNLTALGQRAEGTLRWYQCFTPSSWIIMAGMITLGITLRALDLTPSSQASIQGWGSRLCSPLTLIFAFSSDPSDDRYLCLRRQESRLLHPRL